MAVGAHAHARVPSELAPYAPSGLARYSGLRKDDFNDVVDGLTSQFSTEIGPARERESSQRHEAWVHAAGGAIRGLKTAKDGRPWVSERLQC